MPLATRFPNRLSIPKPLFAQNQQLPLFDRSRAESNGSMWLAIQLHLRNHGLAETVYRRCFFSDQYPADAACNIALLCAGRDEADVAMTWLRRSLEIDPDHGLSHFTMGNLHMDSGDYTRAQYAFKRAAVTVDTPDVFFNLALSYLHSGDTESSVTVWRDHKRTGGHRGQELLSDERADRPVDYVADLRSVLANLYRVESVARSHDAHRRVWHIGLAIAELETALREEVKLRQ